jgi:hypothetical protein
MLKLFTLCFTSSSHCCRSIGYEHRTLHQSVNGNEDVGLDQLTINSSTLDMCHLSGGHFLDAVTFGLWLEEKVMGSGAKKIFFLKKEQHTEPNQFKLQFQCSICAEEVPNCGSYGAFLSLISSITILCKG